MLLWEEEGKHQAQEEKQGGDDRERDKPICSEDRGMEKMI